MTPLEERYRRVLRLLPGSYRQVWEEDMVATFLAGFDTDDPEEADYTADYGRPSWPEIASVVALAVRLRVGTAGAPPRYAAWGGAIRLWVLTGMMVNAAFGTIGAAMAMWLAGLIPLVPAPPVLSEPPGYPGSWHQLSLFAAFTGVLWLPAFLGLVLGERKLARWLGLAAAVAAVTSSVLTVAVTGQRVPNDVGYQFLIDALLVAGLLAFHRGAPAVRRRPWLAGFAVSTVAIVGYALLMHRPEGPLPPLDWAGLTGAAVFAAAVVHVVLLVRGRLGRFTAWTPALALLAFTVLGLRLVTLLDYARFGAAGWHPATIPLAIAEAVAVAVAGLVLALLSARALRRLPTADTGTDAAAWSTPTW